MATISDGFCFEFQFTDLDVIFWVVCGVFKEDVVFVYPESGRKKRKKNELQIFFFFSHDFSEIKRWGELEPPIPLFLPCHRCNLTTNETKPPSR